ncbi:MAG: phosphonate C-P lyase system protein PhnH [Alphaproteobacteria bacterium]|nr:phosphonate C-P lyase system protein PhnH [Alphaproteobacteria bacterium]
MVAAAFADPVLSAQATFRAVLDATARPGTIVTLSESLDAPSPLAAGAAAIALTLCDHDTQIWLDAPLAAVPAVGEWLRFHTAARLTAEPTGAAFAFVAGAQALPPFEAFNPGTLEYPDRSTTIVVAVASFHEGAQLVLCGPGIAGERAIRVAGLPPDILARLAENRRLFPRGVDLLLVCGSEIMALPRTTRVETGDD